MGLFTTKILLKMVDDTTGETISQSKIKATDLPESFAVDTTMHLGEEDWFVVDAVPATREEYLQTKSVTLRLRRVEHVDPGNILYSLPTIADYLPTADGSPVTAAELVLHEDDWRQTEFVSQGNLETVKNELNEIRRIVETANVGPGFKEIHVRKEPKRPLGNTEISIHDILRCLGLESIIGSVTFAGCEQQITNSFSISLAERLSLYGMEADGTVSVLAVAPSRNEAEPSASISSLTDLLRQKRLSLVDWCRCEIFDPGEGLTEIVRNDHPANLAALSDS
jgi:hypothetical protein